VTLWDRVKCAPTNSTAEATTGDQRSNFPWKRWAKVSRTKQIKMVGFPISKVPHLPGSLFYVEKLKKEHWIVLLNALTKFSGAFGITRWSEGMLLC